jgi:hypothetical protein
MNPFSMVVAIVLIVTAGRVLMHMRDRSRGAAPQAAVDSAETMRLRQEVGQLKERVQVLERVITDNRSSADLVSEIERLRDR